MSFGNNNNNYNNDDEFDSYQQNNSSFGNNGRNNNFNNNNNYNNYNDDGGDDYYDDNGDCNTNTNLVGTGFSLKMRGLPFKCTDDDIYTFFQPVRPVSIFFTQDPRNRGRPSGECECEFDSADTLAEAMKFDKKYIGTRYIELFNLTDGANNNRSNRGNFNGGGGGGGRGNSRGGFNNGGGEFYLI